MNDEFEQKKREYEELRSRINNLLDSNGVKKNTKSWFDYERCKGILEFGITFSSPEEYAMAMKIISDWVNI